MSADRNLLFGILALQLNFVTRDQLVEGMHAWVLDKTKSLGQILVGSDAMDAEQQKLLDALVDKHVQKNGGDLQRSIQLLSSVDPHATEQLRAIEDADLQASIATFDDETADLHATQPFQLASKRSSSRFRIIRPHARGGLGEVFVAQDTELSREVALKEIQDRFADNIDSRERFLREAEITGRLEHPGIVPVYGLGTYDDGRPFYAMKFVKGDSLKDAIDKFHSDPHTKAAKSVMTGSVGIKFRGLLGRFVDVCNAVHYAHSRGILHRDLKPGNIMIGEYGETLVVDWGLAKVLGESTVEGAEASVLEPIGGSNSAPTLIGIAVGTPAYMSPEQARGDVHEMGPSTDIYNLGATLYQLLTGRAPYQRTSSSSVLEAAAKGDFTKPRAFMPAVPLAIQAVCVKAMAVNKEDRYKSALELASDIRKILADEPISIHSDSVLVWLARIGRRRPRMTTAIIVGSFFSIVATTLLTWVTLDKNRSLANSNRDLSVAKLDVERQRKKAEDEKLYAIKQLHLAEKVVYSNCIQNAERMLRDKKLGSAADSLDACQWNLRGWEYTYLRSELSKGTVQQLGTIGKGYLFGNWSPSGESIVCGSEDGSIDLWEPQTGNWKKLVSDVALTYDTCWSPDSKKIAAMHKDGALRIWQTSSEAESLTIPIESQSLYCQLTWSVDGRRIALPSSKTVKVFDSTNGADLLTFLAHRSLVTGIAWSSDDRQIASIDDKGNLLIWDANTGGVSSSFKIPLGECEIVGNLYWLPGNPHVLIIENCPSTVVVDVTKGKIEKTFSGSTAAPSPDGRYLATLAASLANVQTLNIWSLSSEELEQSIAVVGPRVRTLSWSPDGRSIVTASEHGMSVVSVASIESDETEFPQLEGRTCNACSPDGKHLARGDQVGTIEVQAMSGARAWQHLDGHAKRVNCLSWSPDCSLLASGGSDGRLNIWDAIDGSKVISQTTGWDGVSGISWSPDSTKLAACGEGGTLIWDIRSGNQQSLEDSATANCVAWSNTGKYIASGNFRGSVHVWRADSGEHAFSFAGSESAVDCLAWSPDDQRIASAGLDQLTRIWNVSEQLELFALYEPNIIVASSLAWHPNGSRLAVGHNSAVSIWSPEDGHLLVRLPHKRNEVCDVVWSQDGTTIFVCQKFNTSALRLLRANGEDEVRPLYGTRAARTFKWSPEGTKVLSRNYDSTASVWSVNTGKEELVLGGLSAEFGVADWSPDAGRIATSDLGGIKIWNAQTGLLENQLSRLGSPIAFSPDGLMIAACSEKSLFVSHLDDANAGRTVGELAKVVCAIAWSPDGTRIAAAETDRKSLFIWKLGARGTETEVAFTGGQILDLGWSADGNFVYLRTDVNRYFRWNLATNQCAAYEGDDLPFSLLDRNQNGDLQLETNSRRRLFVRSLKSDRGVICLAPWNARESKWHMRQAELAEKERQWFTVVFHLRQLLAHDPDNSVLKARLSAAVANVSLSD